MNETSTVAFDDPALAETLDGMGDDDLDRLDFGVIAVDETHHVVAYNRFESERAGISADRVLGRHLFEQVAPCTNNYLISQRYLDDPALDDTVDYVFTLRMAPTPVTLRLLAGERRSYMVVRPR